MGKKKWTNMEIIRVKLNPEQAVLLCCMNNAIGTRKLKWYATPLYTCQGIGARPVCRVSMPGEQGAVAS